MAGALKIVQNRIKGVQSVQKITKSMKMVSVAKYGRAERLLRQVRPFGETTKKFFELIPLQPQNEEMLLFVMSSDRGLCGGCHTYVSRYAARYIENSEDKEKDTNLKLVCVGDKSRSILQYKYRKHIIMVVREVGKRPPTFLDASLIALGIRGTGFINKNWVVIYNKFKSMVSYETTNIMVPNIPNVLESPRILPYDDVEDEDIESYCQFAKAAIIYYALVECSVSEHAARVTAMDKATTNASEMLQKLRLKYNRGRQANITKELIEIISGAAALKTDD